MTIAVIVSYTYQTALNHSKGRMVPSCVPCVIGDLVESRKQIDPKVR